MKKNIIGHMTTSKAHGASRFRRLHLLSRFVCLLLALTIWLLLANLSSNREEGATENLTVTQEESV